MIYNPNTIADFLIPKIKGIKNTAKVCKVSGIGPILKVIFEQTISSASKIAIMVKSLIFILFIKSPQNYYKFNLFYVNSGNNAEKSIGILYIPRHKWKVYLTFEYEMI